jgi:hypothetical protein
MGLGKIFLRQNFEPDFRPFLCLQWLPAEAFSSGILSFGFIFRSGQDINS